MPVLITSSATREGLDALATELLRAPPRARSPSPIPLEAGRGRARRVPRLPPRRRARVRGREDSAPASSASPATVVERLIARHDLENEEALAHVERRLQRRGVIGALESAGFVPGDDVEIGGIVFELDPGDAALTKVNGGWAGAEFGCRWRGVVV